MLSMVLNLDVLFYILEMRQDRPYSQSHLGRAEMEEHFLRLESSMGLWFGSIVSQRHVEG